MSLTTAQIDFLKRCGRSPTFFINNLAYIQHPTFGKIPFRLFNYQRRCLADFIKFRLNIFHKVRQSGVSTLCGAFALWRAMFYKNKTILIVSKRDPDAMEFLRRNIKYVYDNLPPWMRDLWPIDRDGGSHNEHRIVFPNGSRITSLTSSPDTLRSHSSTLNIIDEAAFMPKMDVMWAGGWPTLQNGGNVIVISTPNGIGNWYWRTVRDAEAGNNDFHLIKLNWYDMDWRLEGNDPATGRKIIVAPTDGIVECTDKEDIKRFGNKKSPWLETQYRGMVSQGNERFFRQEYLCDFLGTGNTVLSKEQLDYISLTVDQSEPYRTVSTVNHVNPATKEATVLDFEDKLWIWNTPVTGLDDNGKQLLDDDNNPVQPHQYVIGVDISSGEANDFSGIEIWDITTKEQVAELRIKCRPKTLAYMIDYLGRWYNDAFTIVERNSIGISVIQELDQDLSYPNLFREVKTSSRLKKTRGKYGFHTSNMTKPELNAAMINLIGEDGYTIKSMRLKHEADIYVHKSKTRTEAEEGVGNTDDLIIAAALGLYAIPEAMKMASSQLLPYHSTGFAPELRDPNKSWEERHKDMISKHASGAGKGLLAPLSINSEESNISEKIKDHMQKFIIDIGGGLTLEERRQHFNSNTPKVAKRKHDL
jgi:hypothetical protein